MFSVSRVRCVVSNINSSTDLVNTTSLDTALLDIVILHVTSLLDIVILDISLLVMVILLDISLQVIMVSCDIVLRVTVVWAVTCV